MRRTWPALAGRVERREVLALSRVVDGAEGLGAAGDREARPHLGGHEVGDLGRELPHEMGEDPPQRLAREGAELLVDRHDAAGVDAGRIVGLEDLVLGRRHGELPAPRSVLLHEAEENDPGPARQDVLQEGLVEPDRLQAPAPVVEPDLVEADAPGAAQSGDDDLAGHGHLHARPQVRHPYELAPVLVSEGHVDQEVLDGEDAPLDQGIGALRADALDVLDGRRKVQAQNSSRARSGCKRTRFIE